MAWKLADLFVSITGDGHPLTRTLGSVKSQLSATGVAFGVFAGNVATGFARMGANLAGGAVAGIGDMITKASDLNETISKLNTVFGASAGKITAQAAEMAKAFGSPKQAILDAASAFGLVGKAAGYSQAQAADMANQMAKLAADASIFYNVDLDVALEKIRSGLVGESEPLRAFGVLLSEDAVKAEAARMGLAKMGDELTESMKVAARASLITKGLSDATGDLARTSGGYSNQVRTMWGRVENMMTELGLAMLPAATKIINGINNLVMDVANSLEGAGPMIEAFANRIGEAGKYIAVGWRELPTVLDVIKLKAQEFFAQVVAVGSKFAGMVWEQFKYGAGQAFSTIQSGFLAMCDVMEAKFGQMIDALKKNSLGFAATVLAAVGGPAATAAKLAFDALNGKQAAPQLPDLAGQFKKVAQDPAFLAGLMGDKANRPEFTLADAFKDLPDFSEKLKPLIDKLDKAMADQKAERPQPVPQQAGAAAAGGDAPAKKKGKAEAITFDLAEFAKDLQKGIFGKDADGKRTADGIGKLVDLAKAGNEIQSKMLKKPGGPGFAV